MSANNQKPHITFIQELCKELPEKQIHEAEETFWAYLEIVKRITERSRDASNVHSHDSTFFDSESLIQSVRD
jgi:hypothetical protein